MSQSPSRKAQVLLAKAKFKNRLQDAKEIMLSRRSSQESLGKSSEMSNVEMPRKSLPIFARPFRSFDSIQDSSCARSRSASSLIRQQDLSTIKQTFDKCRIDAQNSNGTQRRLNINCVRTQGQADHSEIEVDSANEEKKVALQNF